MLCLRFLFLVLIEAHKQEAILLAVAMLIIQ